MKKKFRLVIKLGTEVLVKPVGPIKRNLDRSVFQSVAKQVVALQRSGIDVVIVSSGAIKAGREEAERLDCDIRFLKKKQLSGLGTGLWLDYWRKAFRRHKKGVVPLFVAYGNWECKSEKNNFEASVFSCFGAKLTPIINENDPISDYEVRSMERGISENDKLASMVALLIKADAVLFLTNVGGIYEADPKRNAKARLYEAIDIKTAEKICRSSTGQSANGTGGVKAKLNAAINCFKSGMRVAVAGISDDVIVKFGKGKSVGTMIGPTVKF